MPRRQTKADIAAGLAFLQAAQNADRRGLAALLLAPDPAPSVVGTSDARGRGSKRGTRRVDGDDEVWSPWLLTDQAARYAGMSVNHFREYVDAGFIEPRRVGNRLRFHVDELDQFIDQSPQLPPAIPAPKRALAGPVIVAPDRNNRALG